MSTYIDMLRAQRNKLKAAEAESPDAGKTAATGEPAAEPLETSPLLPDDDAGQEAPADNLPLAEEAVQAEQPASATHRGGGTHIDMLRAHQAKTTAAPAKPDQPLSDELPEMPRAMMQEEFAQTPGQVQQQDDVFGSTFSLSDEVPGQSHRDTAEMTETGLVTTQAAWLSTCVEHLLRIYEDAGHNTPADLSPLMMHLGKFTDAIYENTERLNALELEISNHIDEFRTSHVTCGDLVEKAVMMMLYGIKVCMQLHMEPQEITRHVAASMLHNIGMALIIVDTRLKETTLSDVERALIRKTPEKSIEYLQDCGIADPVLLQAARQAQERYDGSGPLGLSGNDIALSARITGLLSMFEALVHFRAYRERLLPRDAIRELVNRYKSQFDPTILKVLIESVSLYPVGTYVQLNSGDVGQVIRVQPRLPLRPRILLSMDRHGNRIQPREVDLREQPNLMVQRCMYAAGLASLKQEKDQG